MGSSQVTCNHVIWLLGHILDHFPMMRLGNLVWRILIMWPNQHSWHLLFGEKWLNIQGFTNFTVANFVAK